MNKTRDFSHLLGVMVFIATSAIQAASFNGIIAPREWVRGYRIDASRTNRPVAIQIAPDGDPVISGSSQNSTNNLDYLILKYRPDGSIRWEHHYDSLGNDEARAMTVDTETNSIVTGTSSTVKIDREGKKSWEVPLGGRDTQADLNFVYVTGFADTNFSVAKITKTGAMVWARTKDFPTHDDPSLTATDFSQRLAIDTVGNVYIGGRVGELCNKGNCNDGLAICKYNANGEFMWETPTGSASIRKKADVEAMVIDSENNVVVLYNCPPILQYFVSRFNELGAPNFYPFDPIDNRGAGTGLGGAGGYGRAMEIGASGKIFTAGREGDNEQQINTKFTVVQFEPAGPSAWRTMYPQEFFGRNEALAISVDGTNFVYAAGFLTNAASGLDFTVIKYSQKGEIIWVDTYDGVASKNDVATGIAVDKNGNVYATGYSETAQGGTEFLTIKYSASPTIEKKSTGAMHLEFRTNPVQQYAIEATSDFFNWQSLVTNTADVNGLVQFDDTNASKIPYRFYRGNTAP